MGGSPTGGLKAKAKNLANDPDFYSKMGVLGGSVKNPTKGFGGNRERARLAGAKGGKARLGKKYV